MLRGRVTQSGMSSDLTCLCPDAIISEWSFKSAATMVLGFAQSKNFLVNVARATAAAMAPIRKELADVWNGTQKKATEKYKEILTRTVARAH